MNEDKSASLLAQAIINSQNSIIGPLAWDEASKVEGVEIEERNVKIKGNAMVVLGNLVNQYASLFGQASVEACRDAVRPLLHKVKDVNLPPNLR